MEKTALLKDLIILLSSTLPVSYFFHWFRLPALTGYLLAGILIGPFGIGLIQNSEEIRIMAEIGVVMLLFTIGLEFSLGKILKNIKTIICGGGLQVLLTVFAVFLVFAYEGLTWQQSIFWGFLVALSSTAIILRLYLERGEIDTPHGKIVVGILLFQDLCVVPMMLILPILSDQTTGL